MDLPSLFAQPASDDRLFLAIVIANTHIQSALWSLSKDGAKVIAKSSEVAYASEAEAVVKTDESLQELGKESEDVNEVIFGLLPSWVDGTGISTTKKPLLKKITDDLSLTAVGFVVTTEAVIQDLIKSDPQVSAMFVHVNQDHLSVSLVKHGKILQTERVGVSGDTAADMAEALARLKNIDSTQQGFPAKIFLYADDLSEEELIGHEQQIVKFDWVTHGLFLHPPVIDRVSGAILLEAIVRQGGKAVAAAEGVPVVSTPSTQTAPTPVPTDEAAAVAESALAATTEKADFGFDEVPFDGKKSGTDSEVTITSEDDENLTAVNSKSFGVPVAPPPFAVPPAVAVPSAADTETAVPSPGISKHAPNTQNETAVMDKPVRTNPFKGFHLPSFGGMVKEAKAEEKKLAHHPFIAAGFLLGLVVLLLGGFLYLKMTTKALVAVQLKSKTISKDVTITLDPTVSSVDTTNLILPATLESKDQQGTGSVATTGVKLVGDKAKGKVTIFNKTTATKTFSAGTVLASGKYQFTLDQEVQVASASVTSGSSSETRTYGKADGTVTASAIGAESNLPKDTELKIASFDSGTYGATTAEALAGGSSREVRVVADADRQKVLSQVKADLLSKLTDQLKTESGNGMYKIPTGGVTIKDATYDNKVGDEADQLTLNLTATYQAVSYQVSNMTPLAQAVLQSQIPSGYQLKNEPPTILSNPVEASASTTQVKLAANLSSVLQPTVSTESWQKELAGLSLTQAQSTLTSKPEVGSATITLQPVIAAKILRSMPAANNIQIELK